MPSELITLKDLLRDPQYREYFKKVPKLPVHYTPESKPWKLIVMKKGEKAWRTKRFGTYTEAFAGLKKLLPTIEDAAINCPGLSFMPPIKNYKVKGKTDRKGNPILKTVVWRPKIDADMEQHHWCSYCRRPSVFKLAVLSRSRQNRFHLPPTPALRCMICGASDSVVDLRNPLSHQGWDANRPKVY